MAKLDLKLRNLETTEVMLATFESEVDARTWLIARPRFVEVLGVATYDLPKEIYTMLRAVVRPLDADEQEIVTRLDEAEAAASRKRMADAKLRDETERAAHREEMRAADPDSPMALRWTWNGGFQLADPDDPREIPAAVQEAVLAWVRERDEWVKDRGQIVGEAIVTVWPGALPKGQSRIQPGGRFTPALAPAKPD